MYGLKVSCVGAQLTLDVNLLPSVEVICTIVYSVYIEVLSF